MWLLSRESTRNSSSPQERAEALLNSKISFGRITTAESKSVDYKQFGSKPRSDDNIQ